MIQFRYYGEIRGKGRPRFRNCGKFIQTYTDKDTQNYEMSIKEAYLQANQESYMNPETPLAMTLMVYQPIPKSVSKKKKQEMLDGKIRPTKKPDIDNILKSVLDSLNQVAFHDDTQIVSVEVVKWYDETPRLVVRIREVENQ
jgi:Holliday junction resolvase RusA-like endonuclease